MITNDYVLLPVRAMHYKTALRFVLGLEDEEDAPGLPDGWTADLIRRQYARTSTRMKRLQKHLAAHPGEAFTGDELGDAIGVDRGWNSVAGMLGGYQRLVQNHYGLSNWPFDFGPDSDGVWKYTMRPAVAEIIAAL